MLIARPASGPRRSAGTAPPRRQAAAAQEVPAALVSAGPQRAAAVPVPPLGFWLFWLFSLLWLIRLIIGHHHRHRRRLNWRCMWFLGTGLEAHLAGGRYAAVSYDRGTSTMSGQRRCVAPNGQPPRSHRRFIPAAPMLRARCWRQSRRWADFTAHRGLRNHAVVHTCFSRREEGRSVSHGSPGDP